MWQAAGQSQARPGHKPERRAVALWTGTQSVATFIAMKDRNMPPSKKTELSSRPAAPAETGGGARTGTAAVDSFLEKLAGAPKPSAVPGTRGRLIFALDATASRQPTWDRACHLQAEMFNAAAALGGLDVQLVFYRGFGECKAGRWVSDAAALTRTMTGVSCLGGHTQIGRVLSHALKEAEKSRVNALVFVGDAIEEDIDALCHAAGQLGLKGLPCFMFQEGDDPAARNAFQQIARLSGGAWCPFDAASALQLKELLAAVAAFAAGGAGALRKLAQDKPQLLALTNQMTKR